jgi:hypothetical protein
MDGSSDAERAAPLAGRPNPDEDHRAGDICVVKVGGSVLLRFGDGPEVLLGADNASRLGHALLAVVSAGIDVLDQPPAWM